MGTGLEFLALAALTTYGMHETNRVQEKAAKKTEKLAKADRAAAPEVSTEQKKIDTANALRGMTQQNFLTHSAGKGSTATGGTVLG